MKYFIFCAYFLIITTALNASPGIRLQKGMIITSSVTIENTTYLLNADTSLQIPLITIEGKNITVDFSHATLQGSNDVSQPNAFYGLAILIKKGSQNIIVKNASIRGFKIAVMADSVTNLSISNCNFSYNYRQHLHSNWQREDISDWMSYHHNENDEWLRYGAGIYLKNCDSATIRNNIITNGQCGLMMMRCNNADIYNNNFSFNSGIGIGLYRSSNNKIYNNRLDFNVRGFSFGMYNRGQDSAGILMFEQCNDNIIAYNSVTHSGDGFFLWAGQYTMNTGKGGCNDNILYDNDFSYAPTNGVELTFSRNTVAENNISGCDNGIWGGYSYNTDITGNKIDSNRIGIAIEQGKENNFIENNFTGNKTAIKLWSRETQTADWTYAQVRDVRSVNNHIYGNEFYGNNIVYDIMGSDSTLLKANTKKENAIAYKLGKRVSNFDSTEENGSIDIDVALPYGIGEIKEYPIPKPNFPQGRNQIRITEWGPYNFEYPYLFLDSITKDGNYHFTLLKKTGNCKLLSTKGFTIVNTSNDHILAKADSSVQDRCIQFEYTGVACTDMFGKPHAANKSYVVAYNEFDPQCSWNINFYSWTEKNDPTKEYNKFIQSLTAPVYTSVSKKIDYTWWGAIGKDLPADSFATVATTSMNLPAADYEIGITADDLAKLFIDNKEVVDAWNAHYTDLDENTHHSITLHLEGKHNFKIVHADINGLADLMFYIHPLKAEVKEER